MDERQPAETLLTEEAETVGKWDHKGRDLEWMLDHGFRLAADGLMEISAAEFSRLDSSRSVNNPEVRTLMIPDDYGLELIFEGLHFRVMD